jgi:23S rRNA pseudouridine1911/1915/1917 synthase
MQKSDQTLVANEQAWTIQPEQVGLRLDRFLVSVLQEVSRSSLQQLITDGLILVNSKTSKSGYALRSGDRVQALQIRPNVQYTSVKPLDVPLDIIYEDADLLVINKAAGMVVHPALGHYEDTLVNALVAHYPELQQAEGDMRPGIVHRLDRDTSGLLIVAKNLQTQAALIEMMKQRMVLKRYLTLVEGNVALEQGSIDAPIGRDPRNRQQMAITMKDSRDARTHFRVQQRFSRHTLLLIQLETGRTHQIRVHLQAIGHPVVSDPVYGSKSTHKEFVLERQFLHAYQLEFTHPTTGEKLMFEAPLPADLQMILEQESLL